MGGQGDVTLQSKQHFYKSKSLEAAFGLAGNAKYAHVIQSAYKHNMWLKATFFYHDPFSLIISAFSCSIMALFSKSLIHFSNISPNIVVAYSMHVFSDYVLYIK